MIFQNNTNRTPSSEELAYDIYGYGDGSPDAATCDKYGYGDASPDVSATCNNKDLYGYGDAAPDVATTTASSANATHMQRRTPRRSSLKSSNDADCSYSRRRRASIQCGEEIKEVMLPGRRIVRRRSSIKFDEQVQVKRVIPTKDLVQVDDDDDDVDVANGGGQQLRDRDGAVSPNSKLWYQDDEYDRIRERSLLLVEYVENAGANAAIDDGRVPCIRGLEGYIGENEIIKQERKDDAMDTVLFEQYQQRQEGIYYDDDSMSRQYRYSCHQSSLDAIERAKADEIAIETYQKSTRRRCRKYSRRLSC